MTYGVTGHRPSRLAIALPKGLQAIMGKRPEYSEGLRHILVSIAWDAISTPIDSVHGPIVCTHLITGMALGWDQACAEACCGLGVPFTAAVPFEGQERRWPAEAQEHYHDLLSMAAEVVIPPAPKDWSGWTVQALLMARNTWVVEEIFGMQGRMLALWDTVRRGGTWDALKKAKDLQVPVDNVWKKFEAEIAKLGTGAAA